MIPARLIRTVPEHTGADVERWWTEACKLHPGWDHLTLRDPLDRAQFPLTGEHWPLCVSGAQLAGLVRLEALHRYGGIYIDSDVQLFRSLEPLRTLSCFAAWEDERVVPDAVIGAEARHPAIRSCITLALERISSGSMDWRIGDGAWATGPGVTTTILPHADGVVLLGPESFYPVHYSEKHKLDGHEPAEQTYGMHHWFGSWL